MCGGCIYMSDFFKLSYLYQLWLVFSANMNTWFSFTRNVLFMLMVTCALIHSGFWVPRQVQNNTSDDF